MTTVRNDGPSRVWLAVILGLSGACGASQAGSEGPGPEGGAPTHTDRAMAAFEAGRLDEADRESEAAVALDPHDPRAVEIAARVAIALGRSDRALEVLAGAEDAVLTRLRGRARAASGDLAGVAADLAPVDGRPPADGWAAVMLPIARSLPEGARAWVVEGDGEVERPFAAGSPLPVIEVEIDAHTVQALVATSADLAVLDESIRARPGLAETMAFGRISIGNVPVITRDLEPVREQLGVDVRAVLGVDVLLRLCATIDFRGRKVVVRRECAPSAADAAEVRFATFGGSFLAVPVTLEGRVEGFWTLDSAGAFPLAIAETTLDALGLDAAALPPAPNAPDESIRLAEIGSVRIGDVAIEGVPAATGLVPRDLAELAGAPIAGIVGAGLLSGFAVTIDARRRRIVLE